MPLVPAPDARAVPLLLIAPGKLDGWLETQDEATRAWVRAAGFEAGVGEVLCLPAADGSIAAALAGWGAPERRRDRFRLAAAAAKLPAGTWALAPVGVELDPGLEALGWLMADYRFDRYRAGKPRDLALVGPEGVDAGPDRADRRGGAAGAGSDQHAGARHGAGGAGGGLRRARRPARRRGAGHARRRGAQGREPADDRGGRRRRGRAAAAARPRLGAGGRAEGDAGRQGRLLRHRRARHQAGRARWG